eukprot:2167600-Amphidinium_carterae.2
MGTTPEGANVTRNRMYRKFVCLFPACGSLERLCMGSYTGADLTTVHLQSSFLPGVERVPVLSELIPSLPTINSSEQRQKINTTMRSIAHTMIVVMMIQTTF